MTVQNAADSNATSRENMEAALAELEYSKDRWVWLPLEKKLDILDRLISDLQGVATEWSEAAAEAKGVAPGSTAAGEEWLTFAFLIKAAAMLRNSLRDIVRKGRPRIPGPVLRVGDGQLGVRVFPQTVYDRIFYPAMTTEIWIQPGVTKESLISEQAVLYKSPPAKGKIALVLGAGNVSILGPCDILDKMFCEGCVVIYKTHPVTDYLTPLLERGMAALIEGRFLKIIRGGAKEGSFLAGESRVEELHLTGSDRTYDAIVFGNGDAGIENKKANRPLLSKPFTCELGNVSPTIVVPGPWSPSDVAYQAEHLAGMLVLNAGFNCLTTRVIIQHAGWGLRNQLLDGLRDVLGRTPPRPAYYPGAEAVYRMFMEAHPEAERMGDPPEGSLPWTLITGLDPEKTDDICFRKEPFCSLFSETAIAAPDVPGFIDRAVRFANDTLWGTLTCTLLVHPKSLKDARVAAAVERAVGDLRYGTVGVNLWGTLNFVTMAGSWGAIPGHPPTDIQSGHGTVHNYLMIPNPQKTVIRGPFRQRPKPLVFPSHRTLPEMGRKLVAFEASPSVLKLPGLIWDAMRA
jgi:hypothetical protein